VDEEERLQGIVSIRNLLGARDDQTISEIYSPSVVSLPENAPLKQAYQLFSKSRFLSLPVVSDDRTVLGVIHAHELVDEFGKPLEELFEERSRGELYELLGVKAEDATKSTLGTAIRRLPWLCLNMLGGSISALCIHSLGGRLDHAVEFLAFVPVLLVLSESIGMQSASMTIAQIHRSTSGSNRSLFLKEFRVALLLGLSCAVLLAGPVFFWKHSSPLGIAMGLTILLGSVGVATLGNAIPRLFHRLRIDPRIAAGPVVLSVADSGVLVLYLLLALWISQ